MDNQRYGSRGRQQAKCTFSLTSCKVIAPFQLPVSSDSSRTTAYERLSPAPELQAARHTAVAARALPRATEKRGGTKDSFCPIGTPPRSETKESSRQFGSPKPPCLGDRPHGSPAPAGPSPRAGRMGPVARGTAWDRSGCLSRFP